MNEFDRLDSSQPALRTTHALHALWSRNFKGRHHLPVLRCAAEGHKILPALRLHDRQCVRRLPKMRQAGRGPQV